MIATCPCHRVFTDAVAFFDHLSQEDGLSREGSLLVALAACADIQVHYREDKDGTLYVQVPLPLPCD